MPDTPMSFHPSKRAVKEPSSFSVSLIRAAPSAPTELCRRCSCSTRIHFNISLIEATASSDKAALLIKRRRSSVASRRAMLRDTMPRSSTSFQPTLSSSTTCRNGEVSSFSPPSVDVKKLAKVDTPSYVILLFLRSSIRTVLH